ncbi:hypothetical protein GGI21_002547 [Coemansia aciculifera]|nr:hypothetical protein GGI21_002547 [Coemansia aciculifera]
MTAALTLALRIAKLDADKALQKVKEEKRYCAKRETAFAEALQGTTDYLLVAATAKVAAKAVSVDVLGRVISEQLKRELSNAYANVEDGLSGLISHFVLVLREHSLAVSAITEWLLDQARAVTGTERQAVCIAGITGISAYHHTSLAAVAAASVFCAWIQRAAKLPLPHPSPCLPSTHPQPPPMEVKHKLYLQ